MSKPGRNDPCPCGSGKKYKQCCISREQDAAAAAAIAARTQAAEAAAARREQRAEEKEDAELAYASNHVMQLIRENRLDEADTAARDLLANYPFVHDGLERLGAVHEARGDHKQAAQYYRKAADFICDNATHYDQELPDSLRRMADQLDPPSGQAL
jgi:tetratricopeptide (TPR) repeat protein